MWEPEFLEHVIILIKYKRKIGDLLKMGVLDKFLDVMKLNGDDDEYDDDFYDEDDDFEDESYEEEKPKKNIFGKKDKPAAYEEEEEDYQLKKSGRSNKVTPMRQPSTRRNAPAMEVCVIKPNAMDDTREITETLLAGRTGSAFAIDGNLQKISSYIFLVTPANVDISGDMQDLLNTSFDVPIQNRY